MMDELLNEIPSRKPSIIMKMQPTSLTLIYILFPEQVAGLEPTILDLENLCFIR